MKHSVKHWSIQIPLGKVCRDKNCPSGFIVSVCGGLCVCTCARANIQVVLPVFRVSERCMLFFEVWHISTAWYQTPWETGRLFRNRSFVVGSCYRGDLKTGSLVAQSVKNLLAVQGTRGSISGSGRYPGEGNGHPLQYSCWRIPCKRSLAGYSPWGCKELDTSERLILTFAR